MRGILKSVGHIALTVGVASCATTNDQGDVDAGPEQVGVITHETHRCELLDDIVTTGGRPQSTIEVNRVSPFVLTRTSRPNEPNRFGYSAQGGNAVGIGERQPDTRWVVRSWRPDPTRGGPNVSLLTKFPDGQVLVSFWTGGGSHVTYEGACNAV
ncbi:hypothetical protein [Roseobacter sp.]|uniref:hypothetical protein n=1 Tax=Roseobacter sp. TaxID=1907202 RepID=UPI00385EA7CC